MRPDKQNPLPLRSADAQEITMEYACKRALECHTLGEAISACARAAGLELSKQVSLPLGFDAGQFSKWEAGKEGVIWPKLTRLMDWCGNSIPVLWMLAQRNMDPRSVRKFETEIERENRVLREQLAAAQVLLSGKFGSSNL